MLVAQEYVVVTQEEIPSEEISSNGTQINLFVCQRKTYLLVQQEDVSSPGTSKCLLVLQRGFVLVSQEDIPSCDTRGKSLL